MARNICSFETGNRVASKLTPELHEQFVQIVAQTGRISIASGKCGIAVSTARHWMQKGRAEESGPYREFLDAVERARSDFLLFANRNLNRLATGGLIRMPSFDKAGNPIRNHKPKCGAAPGYPCDCELVYIEKVVMPNPNVLMWQVDRLDPSPNGDATPDVPERPELSQEERQQRAFADYSLLRSALLILEEIGQPLQVSLQDDSIEITTKVTEIFPELPAPATIDVTPTEAAKESRSSETAYPPTEQTSPETTAEPTEPEPKKFHESF